MNLATPPGGEVFLVLAAVNLRLYTLRIFLDVAPGGRRISQSLETRELYTKGVLFKCNQQTIQPERAENNPVVKTNTTPGVTPGAAS